MSVPWIFRLIFTCSYTCSGKLEQLYPARDSERDEDNIILYYERYPSSLLANICRGRPFLLNTNSVAHCTHVNFSSGPRVQYDWLESRLREEILIAPKNFKTNFPEAHRWPLLTQRIRHVPYSAIIVPDTVFKPSVHCHDFFLTRHRTESFKTMFAKGISSRACNGKSIQETCSSAGLTKRPCSLKILSIVVWAWKFGCCWGGEAFLKGAGGSEHHQPWHWRLDLCWTWRMNQAMSLNNRQAKLLQDKLLRDWEKQPKNNTTKAIEFCVDPILFFPNEEWQDW